jgi:hypothetical protein
LLEINGLVDRMADLMSIEIDTQSGMINGHKDLLVERILEKMWCFNQTYNLAFNNMVTLKRKYHIYDCILLSF